MKSLLIAICCLTLAAGSAAAKMSPEAGSSWAATGAGNSHREGIAKMLTAPAANGTFAQLTTTSRAPLSSSLVLTLVVVFVITLRLMGLNRARAMADFERSSYREKAQMFHSLHQERTDLR